MSAHEGRPDRVAERLGHLLERISARSFEQSATPFPPNEELSED